MGERVEFVRCAAAERWPVGCQWHQRPLDEWQLDEAASYRVGPRQQQQQEQQEQQEQQQEHEHEEEQGQEQEQEQEQEHGHGHGQQYQKQQKEFYRDKEQQGAQSREASRWAPVELRSHCERIAVASMRQHNHYNHHTPRRVTMLAAAALVSSCCLLLTLAAGPSQCAPTGATTASASATATVSNTFPPARHQPSTTTQTLAQQHKQTTASKQHAPKQRPAALISATPSVVPALAPQPKMEPEQQQQRLRLRPANNELAPLAGRPAEPGEPGEPLDSEEETILLVLTSEASANSLRRLIKRSGISDQRLAEIQMMRALRKQLEREAAAALKTGGQALAAGNGSDSAPAAS